MHAEASINPLARRAWNILIAFLYIINILFGMVPPVVAQEPGPTLLTDKADYFAGETVNVTGAYWQGDAEVHLLANDEVSQSWQYDITVGVDADGLISTSFVLPDYFVAQYSLTATGKQTGRQVVAYFTDAPALTLTKSASPLTYTAAGEVINFSYLLQNTGTTTLNGPFTVTDNKVPSVSCPATPTLAPGASITCTGTYTITAADLALGYAVNVATATSSNPGALTSNTDTRIVSLPVDCRTDTNGANDVPGQKDLTQECIAPSATNPLVISWNWDEIVMSGGNSADACALFDTNNDGLANYALCASWQNNRVMQAGYPVLYSCSDTRSDRCTGSIPLTISNGSACALELSPDDPFNPVGNAFPNDTKAFCSINLADVGGATISNLIDVCSYPSAVPNSDPSDCVLITASKGNLEVIKRVVPNDTSTNWDVSWTGPTPYSGTITGSGTTGIQAVNTGTYNISETAGSGTDLSLYDSTWACTVNGAASTSGNGASITSVSVAKGNVVICTFTNTRKTGSLEIKKDVVPDNASTNWNFAVTGPIMDSCTITGDGTCGAKTVVTGSYNITETAGSGTTLSDYGTSYACTVNGIAGASGSGTTITGLAINKSDTVVCTFTNSQSPGTLTVNKVLVPSTDAGKFNLTIDGTANATDVGDGGTTGAVGVSAGSHTAGETAGTGTDLANYVTTISGDCDSSGNVSVGPNQAKTCIITNTRKGNIIIKKVTDPTGQAGDFTFIGAVSGTIQAGGSLPASNLVPGAYSVTETSLASDFALESITCDDANSTGDVATKKASITLDAGETVTCTFTNKKLNPDLAVTKTADAAAVTAGDAVGFSISVKNNGLGTAYNVTLSDPLPAIPGVTWSISPAVTGCSITSGTLNCTFGNLATNASSSVHVTGTTTGASCGTWNNTATAQADNNAAVTGSASIFVDCATIKITKTASSGTVSAGDPLGFTITVTNDNTGTAHNVTVSDTLPVNLGLGTWTLSGADAGACSISAGILTCNFGDVAGHASKTVTLTTTTTAATCGDVSNKASVSTSNDGNDESTATVTVQCPALSVTKTPDASTVNAGDPIGFTITVHNAGPGVAKSVTLTDTLPAGMTWTSTPGSPTCTITGRDLTCNLGDLASGADATVHVAATSTPLVCGPLTNTATATPTNGAAATSPEATITVNCADVTVTKTGNGPVSAGDTATFTITVAVTGSGSLSNVTLSDPLPAGVTWAIDPAVTGCEITGTTSQTLSCSWATLAAGTEISIVVSGTTDQADCAAPLSNTATVAAANEMDTTNNTASASIKVDCASIQIEKTASSGTVSAGDPISYTITVTNPGAGIARNVVVTDNLPLNAGLNWSYPAACSLSGGLLTCSLGDIASGGSKSITLTSPTTAATCGTVSNTASVTTTNDGAATTPAAVITVQCPSLSVTKTPDAASVSAGDAVGFTITVSNAGPGEAKGVAISDSLPGGLIWTFDAANTTASGCSITSGALTCGPETIASGGSIKVHVTAVSTPAVCGTLSNSATVTPTNGTAVTSDTATITVLCPDLTVAKSGNGPISAGDTATFTIVVKNIGLGEAKNVTLTDTLPGGLTWALDPANPACSITGTTPQVLSCSWPTLAKDASVSVSVSAVTTKENCGTLSNDASAAAANEANTSNNNSGDVDLEVDCATIQIEKTTSTPSVSAGDPISYTITVSNTGLGTAKDVVVTDSLPGGLTWSIDTAHSDTGCSISGSSLTCNFGSLASGESKSVTVTATTTAVNCGTLTNTASVTTSNDGAATAPATDITVLCPRLSVTKTADSDSVSAGDTIGFTITVNNAGPGEAKGVTISDSLPGNLTWAVEAANTTASNCSITGGVLTCGPDTIVSGGSIKVHVTAVSTPAVCGTLSNSATATPTNGEAATSQTATITVLCPDLTVVKTGNGPISAGDTASFTILVKNTGLGEAKNVSLTDTLPAGVTWALTPAVTGCSISSTTPQVLSCAWTTLAASAEISIVVSGTTSAANCSDALVNGVTISASNEANTSNNSATASITVNCATIQIEKTTTTGTVSAGTPINFTITVTNTGAGTARNVVVTDNLPTNDGLNWTIDPAVSGCSIIGTTLTCSFGDIASGGSASVTLTSPTTAASCGTISNTASVTTTNDGTGQSSASITVNCPDLTVEKTGNGPINAGDTAIYTITVTNSGAGDATSVTLSDQLPAGIAWSVDNAACNIDGSNLLTCGFGTLAAGASITIHVSGPIPTGICGPVYNTVTVAATNEALTTNNSATGSVIVNCARISITKTAASPISAGDTLAYTITVTNTGAGTAYGVTVTDLLPTTAGLGPWTFTPGNPTCDIVSGKLSCSLGNMPAGDSQTITLTSPTTYASCGTISNEASVATTNDGSDAASANVTVQCPALVVTKTADAATVSAGDQIGFTMTVTNTGDGIARNVTLSDTLPTGTGISWSIASSDPTCTLSGASLSCTFGDLAKDVSKTVHVTSSTTKDSCTTYDNTATALADNQPSVTSTQASITVQCASIQIEKTADTGPFSAGDTIGFTVNVTNPGPGSAYGVTITDTLPTNTGLAWAISPAAAGCAIDSGVLTCNVGTLTAGGSFLVHIASPTTAATCGTVENSASVSTTNDGGGSAGDSITVNCPDVSVTKTAASGPVSAGDPISFNITVTNTGTGLAKGVTLTDTLPSTAGLNWSVGGTDAASCSITSGVVTCDFGDLAPSAVRTITLTSPTTKDSCTTISNTATVASTNEPAGQPNNSSTASIDVLCAAIAITKTPNATTVNAGDPISFDITVTNNGQGTAKNISITDALPDKPGLSWTISSITPPEIFGSCQLNLIAPQSLACNFNQLAAGQSVTVKVSSPTTLATACATIDNTASVTTGNDGTDQASASISVTCAHIDIIKTPVSATVSAGEPIAYDITVTNSGLSAASNVAIADALPDKPGLSWTISSITPPDVFGSCQLNLIAPQTLHCTFDQLAAGQSVTIRVSSPTTYASCGTISNIASVTTSNDGEATTPASSITVNCPALEVTKTPDTQTVSAGEPISFTIAIKNTGTGTAKHVTLSDQLPLGMTWSLDNSACSIDANGLLTCSFDDLAPDASASVTVTGDTVPALCGTFDNTATVKMDNGPDINSNTVNVTVKCPDITVTKEAVSGTINAGDTAAFKMMVTNNGVGTAYGVTLTDTLPTGVAWTITPAVAECSITGGVLSCAWPNLAAGASVEIDISGATDAADCGKLDNTVTVAAANEAANQTNNQASASITVNCSDVSVTKEAFRSPINAGDTAAFKILATNSGPGTAYNVTLTDTLPAGISWTIDPAVTGCAITGNTLSCSWVTLAAGASVEIPVSGVTSAANCGTLSNTVTVAASNEAKTDNNSASASITVNCPDIKVTKTAAQETIHYGQEAAFSIVIENTGAGTAYGVTLTDTLPGGLDWAIDPAVAGCAITSGVLTCSWSSLSAGAAITVNVKATPSGPANCGDLSNTVTAAATNEKGSDTANNTATATISVTCPVDLTVSKTANATFKRTFAWDISKSVDKTLVKQVSGTVTFNYGVTVTETGYTDSDWLVTGKITVSNPNTWVDIPLTGLTDTVNNGGTCEITGFAAGANVPAGKSVTYDYTCTYAAKPVPYAGVNTATATWDASIGTPLGSASNTANFTFDTGGTGNPTNVNKTVTITDTFNGTTYTLGTLTAVTIEPYTTKTFTYIRSVTVTWDPCKSYTNTAKIVETGQTASQTVTVCGPIKTGALTIGYWQNKNGQSLITKAGAVSGVCKLTPYLRQFAPFSDLSATASCSTVAAYVTKIIKAANASGASMNAMLKAQMLATALDVYFSDPALGGNKIGALAPIGGVIIDLTNIRGSLNVSAAFGGATSMKIMDMLKYAASQSNVGGSMWYGNIKSTQGLAKDAFDAINNQWVFAP